MEEMYALARCRQWYSAHCATSLAALARSAECSAQQTNDHAANGCGLSCRIIVVQYEFWWLRVLGAYLKVDGFWLACKPSHLPV